MRFKTEDRMLHPCARLIPQRLWVSFFKSELSPIQHKLMRLPLSAIETAIRGFYFLTVNDPPTLWMAVVVSKPEATAQELIIVAMTMFQITSEDLLIYATALNRGDIVDQLLLGMSDDAKEQMIAHNHYTAFRKACEFNLLPLVEKLLSQVSAKKRMIAAVCFDSFHASCQRGHFEIINTLFAACTPEEGQEMIASFNYYGFNVACADGRLDVVNELLKRANNNHLVNMIKANQYSSLRVACAGGHLAVAQRLLMLAGPELQQEMISANDFSLLSFICHRNHVGVAGYILEMASPANRLALISRGDYFVFNTACQKNQQAMVNLLLSHSCCYAYADSNDQAFGEKFIDHFIEKTLEDLYARQLSSADGSFNLNENEALLHYYIAHTLIRRTTHQHLPGRDLDADLEFLLNLAPVRVLASMEIEGIANRLLRLAIAENNCRAAELLLEITAVRKLAAENNFYDESNSGKTATAAGLINRLGLFRIRGLPDASCEPAIIETIPPGA